MARAQLAVNVTDLGLSTTGIDATVCCYATKVETWVTDPDGARWEWCVKTGDAEQLIEAAEPVALRTAAAPPGPSGSGCCG